MPFWSFICFFARGAHLILILIIILVQVRIQLGEGSAGQVTRNMLANEGVRSFYKVCFVFLGAL